MVDFPIAEFGGMALPGQEHGPNWEKLDALGSRFSLEVCNGVRWPGHNKNLFTCRHGFSIPAFRLAGPEDWSGIKEEHDGFVSNQRCTN